MKKIGIYMIKNEINGNFYIGSSKNINKRWTQHKSDLKGGKHKNIHLQRSYNKYGNVFSYSILEETDDDNLLSKEQEYIDKYKNDKFFYNIGLNSSGGDNLTNNPKREEIIEKISISVRKCYESMSEKDREKFKKYGKDNPNYGNKWSKEMREDASKRSKEYYSNHDQSLKGKKLEDFYDEETVKNMKEKMSNFAKTRTGEKNPFYGKQHSDETKEKLREKKTGKYYGEQNIPFTIDDIKYNSLGEASKKLGIHITTIRWRLISKNKKFENYQYDK